MLQALRSGPALRSCFERINVRFRSNIAPSTMASDQEERPNELAQTGAQAQMPALSAHEERRWNRLSNNMSHFHEHFKQEFNALYELADGSFNKHGLSLAGYLRVAQDLKKSLTMHHTIEERFIFPTLALRMPQFKGEHLESHKGIHDGLDQLDALLTRYKSNPSSYSPTDMRACLDSWREVLFRHLDEEVADLRGENLRKYWTLQEVERLGV